MHQEKKDQKILIVEDTAIQAELLRRILAKEGYDVFIARNGVRGLEAIRKNSPAIVVSDIVMPEMDGYEMCRRIKEDNELSHIPVILLTQLSDPKDIILGIEAKADSFITKPYNENHLLRQIESFFLTSQQNKSKITKNGLEIRINGDRHLIKADASYIFDFLLSMYNDTISQNRELLYAQRNLKKANDELKKNRDKLSVSEERYREQAMELEAKTSELEESRESFHNIVEKSADGVIVLDMDGKVNYINPAGASLLNKPREQIEGTLFGFPLSKDGLTEICLLGSKGKQKVAEMRVADIKWKKKDAQLASIRDISERREMENKSRQMQVKMLATNKMATLGEISVGIAHEINQPLTYIKSVIQGLHRDIKENSVDYGDLSKELKVSNRQINRIESIIQHLRTFGRAEDTIKIPVSIEEVLKNTILLMGERIRLKNIKLSNHIESKLPEISGNMNQLEQVFINLFQNSVSALKDRKENAEISVHVTQSEDRGSIITEIKDNGCGIDSEISDKIFDPFFTTKDVGEGAGLGLSIVYGIIKDHKGEIRCESINGKGTTFIIFLPVMK